MTLWDTHEYENNSSTILSVRAIYIAKRKTIEENIHITTISKIGKNRYRAASFEIKIEINRLSLIPMI